MHPAVTALLPLLASRGFRARRWRWRWSTSWQFSDDRGNVVAIERLDAGWRIRRERHLFLWTVASRDDWTVRTEELEESVKMLVPLLPWWIRHPKAAISMTHQPLSVAPSST